MTGTVPQTSPYEVAADWCLRLDQAGLTLEEQAALEVWLADPLHAQAFASVGALWRETDEIADAPLLIDLRAEALGAMRAGNARRWNGVFRNRRAPFAAAAAMFVLCGALMAYHQLRLPVTYTTGTAEHRVITLADGSRVSLDADTSLAVDYSDERRALNLLAGRAKFDVAKDPRRPFTVSAGGRMVVATGTAFSVELLRKQMQVILYEGNVAVLDGGPANQPPRHIALLTNNAGAADQQLKPGTILIANLDLPVARVKPADVQHSLSWERGQFNFDDEPLALAVERINRYSNRHIIIADQPTARLLVSGAFNSGDTDGFVDGIRAIYPLAIRQEGNEIVIGQK